VPGNGHGTAQLLDALHEGVWTLGPDGRPAFVNAHFARMLGYTVEELGRKRPQDLLDAGLRNALARVDGGPCSETVSAEGELLRKDGAGLPVRVSVAPLLDRRGGYGGMVWTAVDLRERKRMEETLRRNQARGEALYALSRLCPATESHLADFTLRAAMGLCQSATGALCFVDEKGRLLPMALRGDAQSLSLQAEADPWREALATGAPAAAGGVLCVPAMDGHRPVAVIALRSGGAPQPQDDGLQVSLLLDGMWREVRANRDRERIAASLREKEALLREVHHRVKNNLQVVASLLDMAGRRLDGEEARVAMAEMRAKVQALSLVHALLHGGPDGAGACRGVSLARHVRALFGQLREVYSGGMELELDARLGDLVLGLDQAAPLGLALNEILANAFKHGRRAGQPGRVSLRAWRGDDGRVQLEIHDEGPGFPEGFVPHRAQSLGLTLVRGLVQNQLGGEITFESCGHGVLVRLCFSPK
jgi:PAS domain S-box-containing protein